jgi:hypothetical protein
MLQKNTRQFLELYVKEVIGKYNPNIVIKKKSESKLFKILAPILIFINPKFFKSYVTFLGRTIWVPDHFLEEETEYYKIIHRLSVIAHEGVHVYDSSWLFYLLYSFPQCLVIPFILLAIFLSPWWLFGLLAILPLPAPGRYYLELKAYRSKRIWNKNFFLFAEDEDFIERGGYLLSSYQAYYGTWPFKKWIEKDMKAPLDMSIEPYKDMMDFITKYKDQISNNNNS